jgi:hypothetical protein
VLGAIVVVGSVEAIGYSKQHVQSGMPLACVEVLGRSALDREITELRKVGLDDLTQFADNSLIPYCAELEQATSVPFKWVEDASASAVQQVQSYRDRGFSTALLAVASAYAEMNYSDFLQSHQEQGEAITRAHSPQGPLDIWVIDLEKIGADQLPGALYGSDNGARYWVQGYVNPLRYPKDLRRLVADSFNGACHLRPEGFETRPGVWMSHGAEVHRGARIVAPAYIGRGSKIEEQCLITRCSNIESNCLIDYGTVVEDSTVLSNTYVGIGLDISHSIVSGNSLLHLERDVMLEIADPGVVRPNKVLRKEVNRPSPAAFGLAGMP